MYFTPQLQVSKSGCTSLPRPRGAGAASPPFASRAAARVARMPLTDRTLLHDTSDGMKECTVEPVALFSIIDHYSRREQGQDFVVGTLLGTEEGGVVTVCSSFPVPHTEVEDQIALNSDFHATMLALQQRVTPQHKVVGWYSTGEKVNENTTLFHEFYGQVRAPPVGGLGSACSVCAWQRARALALWRRARVASLGEPAARRQRRHARSGCMRPTCARAWPLPPSGCGEPDSSAAGSWAWGAANGMQSVRLIKHHAGRHAIGHHLQ